MARRALITGVTGQDGVYLAELLLSHGYQVFGFARSSRREKVERLEHLPDVELIEGDLLDEMSILRAMKNVEPHEVYNLAAQSFIPTSFSQPLLTAESTAIGATRLLEAIRLVNPEIKFFQAGSSEVFGKPTMAPQNEQTPFHPSNPYGAAKAYAHWMTANYREHYDLFACNGILFNHESPWRGVEYVTRHVTLSVAKIAHGVQKTMNIGNLDARRDWGFAGDYVAAMWRMLQQDAPDDYVIATGVQHTVRDIVVLAFQQVGLDWEKHVRVDSKRIRKSDVHELCGDATKAREKMGWRPTVSFPDLIAMMVEADMRRVSEQVGPQRLRAARAG